MIAEKNVKEIENSAVELTITVAKETVAEKYRETVNKYAKSAQVKGFRKGKVPPSILEQKFGESLKEESVYNLIEKSVEETLKNIEQEYAPLSYSVPKLKDEENIAAAIDQDLVFTISYDVYPKFELGAYEGLSVEVPAVEVSESQIDAEIEKLQDQNALVIEKDGTIEKDDIVTIDYCELDADGNEIENMKREDYVFTVGTGFNFYKIDEDIIGMAKDEEKTIEKTYPEDHDIKEYAGKTISLKVSVKTIKHKDIPVVDDDFAQDISESYNTVEDLRNGIKSKLSEELENRLKEYKLTHILDEIIATTPVAIPESMIQAELENSWRKFASQSGMNEEQLEQILSMQNQRKEDILENWKPQSVKSIHIQLIMEKIVEKEAIAVEDTEVEEEYAEQLKTIDNEQQKEYFMYVWKEDLKTRKAADLLLEKNTFTTGESMSFEDFAQQRN